MLVSVIITYYNSKNHVKPCIFSLLKTRDVDYEVIIVDDNSHDSSRDIINQFRSDRRIKYIYLSSNVGISGSRNIGVRSANGKYLIFLDIDCRVQKNTIKKLIEPMENNSNIGMIQALLLNKDGSIETAGHYLSIFGFPYNSTIASKDNSLVKIFGARGILAIRKNIFNKIGGYDKDHKLSGEDTDLAWRTWKSGSSVYCNPKSKVFHLQEESLSERMYYRIYYEGSKTLMSMLLKNLPATKLLLIFPLNILVWSMISIKLLIKGKIKAALWIYKGIGWNISNFANTIRKRKRIKSYRKRKIPADIMFGSLSLKNLFSKAMRWSRSI